MNAKISAEDFTGAEAAVTASAAEREVRIDLEPATLQLWEMSCRQYDAFSPGKYEWPALKRRCDRADPSYRD